MVSTSALFRWWLMNIHKYTQNSTSYLRRKKNVVGTMAGGGSRFAHENYSRVLQKIELVVRDTNGSLAVAGWILFAKFKQQSQIAYFRCLVYQHTHKHTHTYTYIYIQQYSRNANGQKKRVFLVKTFLFSSLFFSAEISKGLRTFVVGGAML